MTINGFDKKLIIENIKTGNIYTTDSYCTSRDSYYSFETEDTLRAKNSNISFKISMKEQAVSEMLGYVLENNIEEHIISYGIYANTLEIPSINFTPDTAGSSSAIIKCPNDIRVNNFRRIIFSIPDANDNTYIAHINLVVGFYAVRGGVFNKKIIKNLPINIMPYSCNVTYKENRGTRDIITKEVKYVKVNFHLNPVGCENNFLINNCRVLSSNNVAAFNDVVAENVNHVFLLGHHEVYGLSNGFSLVAASNSPKEKCVVLSNLKPNTGNIYTKDGLNISSDVNITGRMMLGGYNEEYNKAIDYPQAIGKGTFAQGVSSKALGDFSHAEGHSALATGIASHAEGLSSYAFGNQSHVEGSECKASADYSHAEGFHAKTYKGADYSHAEGYHAQTFNHYSHAEGNSTKAQGFASHVEGHTTAATDHYAHAEGQETIAAVFASHSEGYKTKTNGKCSHAEGHSALATGIASHAEGLSSYAFGNQSHAEGKKTNAIGVFSHAEGVSTHANGVGSHAEGYFSNADGDYSFAKGVNTHAIGEYSHADGNKSYAYGDHSRAIGHSVSAIGDYSYATGRITRTYGIASHAEGEETTTGSIPGSLTDNVTFLLGDYAHAEGHYSCAYGNHSHAEGIKTITTGYGCHAEGWSTRAGRNGDKDDKACHAEGDNTTAVGYASHAEGEGTIAIGRASHAEGSLTQAKAKYSFVHGTRSEVVTAAENSIAMGMCAQATGPCSFVWNAGIHDNIGDFESRYKPVVSAGTFNIYPEGGTRGFYIGYESLADIISAESKQIYNKINNALSSSSYTVCGSAYLSDLNTLVSQNKVENGDLYNVKDTSGTINHGDAKYEDTVVSGDNIVFVKKNSTDNGHWEKIGNMYDFSNLVTKNELTAEVEKINICKQNILEKICIQPANYDTASEDDFPGLYIPAGESDSYGVNVFRKLFIVDQDINGNKYHALVVSDNSYVRTINKESGIVTYTALADYVPSEDPSL